MCVVGEGGAMGADNEPCPRLTALKGQGNSKLGCLPGSPQHGGHGFGAHVRDRGQIGETEPGAARVEGPEGTVHRQGAGQGILT